MTIFNTTHACRAVLIGFVASALVGCFDLDDAPEEGADTANDIVAPSGNNTPNSGPAAPPAGDGESPRVGISSPTSGASLTTGAATITLSGFASDNVGVNTMDWISSRGGADIIEAGESWRTGAITLLPGANVITVTAADAAGNSTEVSLTINYDEFLDSDMITPPVVKVSYNADLSDAFLLDGQELQPVLAYLVIEPSTDWTNRTVEKLDFYCCKGLGDSDEPHQPRITDRVAPYVQAIDLSQFPPGERRELYLDAWLATGERVEDHVVTFTVEAVAGSEPPTNRAPSISGTPATSVTTGVIYDFVPSASDADGDSLIFSAANLPSWAGFNELTGQISGTPGGGDVGSFDDIRVTVFDGTARVALAPFSINVVAAATGSASLSWTAPDMREDDTPLTNLAGYRVYYGNAPGSYPNRVEINSAGVTSTVIDGLVPGEWYFVATSIDSTGLESDFTNEVVISVQ